MLSDRRCKYCEVEYKNIDGRVFSNHVKWCNHNPLNPHNIKVKCDKCGEEIMKMTVKYHVCKQSKECKNCGKSYINDDKNSTFCSQSCSAIYNNKHFKVGTSYKKYEKETRICSYCGVDIKISTNISSEKKCMCDGCRRKKMYIKTNENKKNVNCVICGDSFIAYNGIEKKTCSEDCYHKLLSINAKNHPNCGGETNYKKFVYKNISMDSSWEVRIAKLMDSLNIKWERSKKLLLWWYDENSNKRRYHPDFYLPEYNLYLDTKNKYLLEQDSYKIKRVLENNNVNIFVGVIDDVEKYVKSLSMGFESLDFQASKGNSHL